MGVNPAQAAPTGPYGRVIERDVRQLAGDGGPLLVREPLSLQTLNAQRSTLNYEDRPASNIRKLIAKNMMASLQNTAQLTHTASFDASNILAYRKLLKNDPALSGVTLTDMVLYAVTRTLPAFPALNAWYMDDSTRLFSDVNLACAVDTDKGLMVPVIFGASDMTLLEISKALKTLAEGCRPENADRRQLHGEQPRAVRNRELHPHPQPAADGYSGREHHHNARARGERRDQTISLHVPLPDI
jgi:pyruvate dehydrogenase E2 component (dihydrolipoamide acetyltransferase)